MTIWEASEYLVNLITYLVELSPFFYDNVPLGFLLFFLLLRPFLEEVLEVRPWFGEAHLEVQCCLDVLNSSGYFARRYVRRKVERKN